MESAFNFDPFLMFAVFFLVETEEGSSILHGLISLVILWGLYGALLTYSPIFHTWTGFTHHPVGNLTTYTSVHHKNLDL